MLRTIGRRLTSFFRATTPDPFVLAVGLTAVVLGLAALISAGWVLTRARPVPAPAL